MIATVLLAAAFLPTWKSVEAGFSVPQWFDDAKFGVECRWGGADATAANWKPDELCALWKRMGARYFIAAGTLKDGVDNWDSAKGEANSLKTGPRRDLLDGWMKAAGRENLPVESGWRESNLDFQLSFLPEGKWRMTSYTDKPGVSAGCDCAETDVTSKDRIKILAKVYARSRE